MRSCTRALLALLLTCFGLAHAETYGLIMTIGAYRNGPTPLKGSYLDIDSARTIALKMGVKAQNIRFYKDNELTLDGMKRAFADLYERVNPGDQVFIYFSGHGGRWLVTEPVERCAESLISVDGEPYTDVDLSRDLRRLAEKAQKLVVFLDSCHSGGATTRSVKADQPQVTPKYFARAGVDACGPPVNVLTRSIASQTRALGSGANNFVYIAAARDNEVSLDFPGLGGIATVAWRDCISGAAKDRDGSGGLTAEEIRVCAQERINSAMKGVVSFLPHHVTITGNANAVLTLTERTSGIGAPQTQPVTPTAQPKPPAASPPAASPPAASPPAASPPAANPPAYYTLLDVYNGRDDRRVITLTASKPAFKVGQDEVGFSLASSHTGYVYLLMVGSDGKTFDMLFPNQIDGNNLIEAGQTLRLPRPSWQIKAGGPAGKNHLLAIVADAPRDFTKLGMLPAGPFSMVQASSISSRDIQLVSGASAHAASPECVASLGKRTLQVQQRCSNAYGAAITQLEEVN